MSFFDDASLVMIPSGYKASKVYSVKPTDGTGDLTFTRSLDTATRVGPDGLIEKVRTNLVLQSVWPSIGAGVAPTSWGASLLNFSAGPLAGQLLCNTSANRGFITQSVSLVAGQFAFSVFVDTVTISNPVLSLISIFGATDVKFYENGIEVVQSTNIVAGKRYATVGTVTTGSFTLRVGSGVTANATANYVISRPQLESSDFGATTYIETTTAAVSVGMLANVPRLDYLGGGCPKLLLEPQRSNDIPNSENIANWTLTNLTRTLNQGISPDGFQNADLIASTTSGAIVFTSDSTITNLVIGQPFIFSFFVKLNAAFTSNNLAFRLSNVGLWSRPVINVNLQTGQVTNVNNASNISSTDYGNGWYRIAFGATPTGTGTTSLQSQTGATMDGGSFFIWGLQAETNSSFATSYIPTLQAAVTRSADAASKTGISALIGQTEGTIFFEINSTNFESYTQRIFTLSDDTNNNVVGVQLTGGNELTYFVANGGVSQAVITKTTPAITLGQNVKVAAAYKANDFVLFVNGVLIGSDTSGSVPATSVLRYANPTGTFPYIGSIAQALLFKTRLSNAQLAELTA